MINYSFIIPHKNTPELLQKCLDSIPRRDDVQIIVVDDNSDPDKVDFNHFPGLDDQRIEVYLTKEGRGAGYARNVGLQHACGKWLVFADADDFFNDDIVEAMEEYVDSDYDIVFFKATGLDLATGKEGNRHMALNIRIDDASSSGNYDELLFFSIPWAKFIRHAFVVENKIEFQEVRWANDVLFSTKCGLAAKSFTTSELAVYCVTTRSGSLIKDPSKEALLTRYEVDCESSALMKAEGKASVMSRWTFQTWLNLYRADRKLAISRVGLIIKSIGWDFGKYLYREIRHSIHKFVKNFIKHESKQGA